MRTTTVWWVLCVLLLAGSSPVHAAPPAQRLPSAVLVYPLVEVQSGVTETRVEIVNLTSTPRRVKCVYVQGDRCLETNFFLNLTPNQPLSWLASQGLFASGSAVPPTFGTAELKCAVLADRDEVDAHNAIQGRAIVYGSDGQTIGYSAVGFQRLSPGEYTGEIDLDGSTYAQCPDELHFAFQADDENPATEDSEIILVPCSQDVLHSPTDTSVVQLRLINEFEQVLSASYSIPCQDRRLLRDISSAFRESFLGSPTGHLIVRGVDSPVLGMLIDRLTPGAALSTSANEPALQGGRSATLTIP